MHAGSLAGLAQIFRPGPSGFALFRPLTTVAYSAFLQSVFAFDAAGHHAFQLGVFAVSAVLVYAIMRGLTGSLVAGVPAGFLYAMAPGHAVGIYWLAAFTVTGTTLALLVLVWCRLHTEGARRAWLTVLLQAIGLLASEHAVVWPALAIVVGRVRPRPEPWRQLLAGIAPAAVLTAGYVLVKGWYVVGHTEGSAYALTADPTIWLQHLGRFMVACCNGLALLAPGDVACTWLGVALAALLCVSGVLARRRDGAWSWIAGGLAFFIVSLLPVLVLRAHYYDYYVGPAVLGAMLAACGLLRLATPRWPLLLAGLTAALMGIEFGTQGRAWRDGETFRLVVGSGVVSARWLQTVQDAAKNAGVVEVDVPRNPVTDVLFSLGRTQTFFPSTPRTVVLYPPDRPPPPAPGRVVLRKATGSAHPDPYPGWEPRWDWLRALAR